MADRFPDRLDDLGVGLRGQQMALGCDDLGCLFLVAPLAFHDEFRDKDVLCGTEVNAQIVLGVSATGEANNLEVVHFISSFGKGGNGGVLDC